MSVSFPWRWANGNRCSEILIATLGVEPQVVTITLDRLLADGRPISAVTVVYTESPPVQQALANIRWDIPQPQRNRAILAGGEGQLFLEELSFDIDARDLSGVIDGIAPMIYHSTVRKRLSTGLAVLTDDDFVYFARYGLQVNARNELDDSTKTSKNLWYEETLPPDSLFYSLLMARPGNEETLAQLRRIFQNRPYLQVGGNETVGQGWCAVSWLEQQGGEG